MIVPVDQAADVDLYTFLKTPVSLITRGKSPASSDKILDQENTVCI